MRKLAALVALAGGLGLAATNNATGDSCDPPYGMSAVSVDTLTLELRWFAPRCSNFYWAYGDGPYANGLFPAEGYELRYSTTPLPSGFDFHSLAPATADLPLPGDPDLSQAGLVRGLQQNTTYWFVLRAWFHSIDDVSTPFQVKTAADPVAPAMISTLATEALSHDSVKLTWTASGDDGVTGLSTRTELRYSSAGPITTSEDFDGATPVPGTPAPATYGTPQSKVVGGLAPSTTYWFAIRAFDEVGNPGTLSSISPSATTGPPPPPGEGGDRSCGASARGSAGLLLVLGFISPFWIAWRAIQNGRGLQTALVSI